MWSSRPACFPPRSVRTVFLALALSSCAVSSIDISSALRISEVTTGWLDVGFDEFGQNKLVPTISFRLENVSSELARTLQLNGIFRRCLVAYEGQPEPVSEVSPANPKADTCAGEPQVWGSSYIRAVGSEGISPGGITDQFTMNSELGYTGEQARIEMLRHKDFVDAKVELFVKHRAEQWVRIGEYHIDRQLLTQ